MNRWIEKNPYPRFTSPVRFKLSQAQQEDLQSFIRARNFLQFDHVTGWLIWSSTYAHTEHNYDRVPKKGILRIAASGDSFTFCDGRQIKDCWVELLRHQNKVESLNFGVSRYGMDQAYLRYKEYGRSFKPNVVLIAFQPENTLRHVNVFRPFYTLQDSPPFTKPRFILKAGRLTLLENPFKRVEDYNALLTKESETLRILGQHDFYYRLFAWHDNRLFPPSLKFFEHLYMTVRAKALKRTIVTPKRFIKSSEAFQITTQILDHFYDDVIKDGGRPIVVFLPRKDDILSFVKYKESTYQPFMDHLKENGKDFIDTMNGFEQELTLGFMQDYFQGGHYTSKGNRIVARTVLERLADRHLLPN